MNTDKGTTETGPSLLGGVSLPAAAVFEPALAHNPAWMQRFADAHGAHLAPHGKTTMTPALFRRQLEAGAGTVDLAANPRVAYLLIESEQVRWRVTLQEAVPGSPVSGLARD